MASVPILRDHSRPPPARLLAEALAAILASSAAVRLVPFRTLAAKLTRNSRLLPSADAETAYWIRRAALAWAKRVPWRALCFEQGLAAHMLLRRRGLASTLHYGAATVDGELKAHVWVTSGGVPVVGCENRDDYGLLARFPA
jgi:Transglutaminase-like superfamily